MRMRTVVLAANPPPLTVVELPIAPELAESERLAAARLVAAGKNSPSIVARATTVRSVVLIQLTPPIPQPAFSIEPTLEGPNQPYKTALHRYCLSGRLPSLVDP